MEFLLKWWRGPHFLHIAERGDENSIKYMSMSSNLSSQVINDLSINVCTFPLDMLIRVYWPALAPEKSPKEAMKL